MISFVTLLAGFILLIWGADRFVEGASALAKKLGIPPLIVGLTVVSFGTSAPELTVSVTAGLNGSNELAISNVLGSNIFNLLVVIGGCALFAPQSSDKSLLKRDWPFTIIASLGLVGMIAFDQVLSRLDGLILMASFFLVVITQVRAGLLERDSATPTELEGDKLRKPFTIFIYIFLGIFCIVVGGDFCVEAARDIALDFGLSETMVGLTVVAIGTSLPELATSVAATRRGEKDIAIGNVVGSTLFNILLILSVSSVLHPIVVERDAIVDAIFVVMMVLLVFILALQKKINRTTGIGMLCSYGIYMTYVVLRDMEPMGEIAQM